MIVEKPTPPVLRSPCLAPLAFGLIALGPIVYMALQVAEFGRNIAYWDDVEGVVGFLLKLDGGGGFLDQLQRFFSLTNEHRTVTSRILFAISYWVTGTVNFQIMGLIGNAFIVAFCAVLIASAGTLARRVRLGVVLAFLLFQLEHFENFLWSGSSIDHFQVVLLAGAALVALVRDTRRAMVVAALLATLATFTLAHGCLVWVIGGAILAHRHRWHWLAFWGAVAAAILGVFFYGFEFNPGHHIAAFDAASLWRRVWYFLTLLGSPVALGGTGPAPWLGLALLAAYAWFAIRRIGSREPVATAIACFAIAALALVAYGRAEANGGVVHSRYMVLAAIAWAMLLFLVLEALSTAERPYRWLWYSLPALVVFNVKANDAYALAAEGSVEIRDRAATSFQQYHEDGHGIFSLDPRPGHADEILNEARRRRVYRFPNFSEPREYANPTLNPRLITYLDQKVVNRRAVTLGGWAMLPGVESGRGQINVILRSEQSHLVFSTVTLQRPDVAKVYREPQWRLCGFQFVSTRKRLPAERFQVGLLIHHHGRAEYTMTDQWIDLTPQAPLLLPEPSPLAPKPSEPLAKVE